MPAISEGLRLSDFLKWEAENLFSREKVQVASGEQLTQGAVIGKITKSFPTTGTKDDGNTGGGTLTTVTGGVLAELGTYTITCVDISTSAPATPATANAFAHNTGDGVMGAIVVGATAKVGVYTLEITKVVGNGGAFLVRYPDGSYCGEGAVGTEFVGGGLTFTLADGTEDFIVGDGFRITVAAATSGAGALWNVTTPSGKNLSEQALTGTAYTSDHLNFTINDSGTNFAEGDFFTVEVSAGSGKVVVLDPDEVDGSQEAYGIMIFDSDTKAGTGRYLAYTSGGTYEIRPGDVVTGATGGATARVVRLTLASGTWAGGDAAGVLYLDDQDGTFTSENLDVDDNSNVGTVAGNSSAYYPDLYAAAIVRDAQIVTDNLVWPSGITDGEKTAALAQLAAKGIIGREEA